MNPQQETPQRPERTSTTSLLDSIAENGIRQEYAKQLIQTEVDNKSFEFEWRLARTFADSGEFDLVKGKTAEQAIASAMAKIQMGKYWGINPADSMRFIRFDRGKPVLENEIIAAKLQEAGWEWDLEFDYDDDDQCTGCRLYPRRKDKSGEFKPLVDRKGEEVVIEFNQSDASKAMIYEKDKWIRLLDKWNFKSWAADMYYTKVIARFKRRYAPGVLVGARTTDEIGVDFEPPDHTQQQQPREDENPFKVQAEPKPEPAKVVPIKQESTDQIMREELGKALAPEPSKQEEKQEVPKPAVAAPREEEPKTEPARGRKAKDPTPPPATTPEPPTQNSIGGTFRASDDDVPEIIGSKPEKTLAERLKAIKLKLCTATGLSSEKQMIEVAASMRAYMKGFLGMGVKDGLPNPDQEPDTYAIVVPLLESLVEKITAPDDKKKPQWKKAPLTAAVLVADGNPGELGRRSLAGWKALAEFTQQWSPDGRNRVAEEAIRMYPDYPASLVTDVKTGAPLAEKLVMAELG